MQIIHYLHQNKNPIHLIMGLEYGASWRIRTSDRSVRSRVLYPAELRMQNLNGGERGIRTLDAAFDRILP